MSNGELLEPRYKIDIPYPDCPFREGDVLFLFCDVRSPYRTYYLARTEDAKIYIKAHPSEFPKIFKKLEWWEDRKPEDMPAYVKSKTTGKILKYIHGRGYNWRNVLPATQFEYENQTKR